MSFISFFRPPQNNNSFTLVQKTLVQKNNPPQNTTGAVKKTYIEPQINKVPKALMNPKMIDERVLWIGNLTPEISETAIRKKFLK